MTVYLNCKIDTPPGWCNIGVITVKSDKARITRMLKTARGQLDGIIKMVEDDRYCIDISNQLMATQAILRNVNQQVLNDHLKSCVNEAFENGDARKQIEEIMAIIEKLTK